ncbi:hypothetical protein LCGC14_0992190 [marine sediment metagenome]|uniref:Uncharacterized protein n=1 Tax=marine sediment metagenome TaxID=412755 RepID=A0A0F9NA45_9ZZZZ
MELNVEKVEPNTKVLWLKELVADGELDGEKFTVVRSIPENNLFFNFPEGTYFVGIRDIIEVVLSKRALFIEEPSP